QGQAGLQIFLDQYIAKKIILNEAEKVGLDKDPQLLSDIQQYWEQELLKLMLSRINQELSGGEPGEAEIQSYFARNKDAFAGKDLPVVHSQSRDFLIRERQRQVLENWIGALKKRAAIR